MALAHSPLGHAMQTSRWGFAVVEMVHLLGLAILGGSVLIVDLRLLGVILKGESAITINRELSRVLPRQPFGHGVVGDCIAFRGGRQVLLQPGLSVEDGAAGCGSCLLLHPASAGDSAHTERNQCFGRASRPLYRCCCGWEWAWRDAPLACCRLEYPPIWKGTMMGMEACELPIRACAGIVLCALFSSPAVAKAQVTPLPAGVERLCVIQFDRDAKRPARVEDARFLVLKMQRDE
jgi:hypothetical protein